MVAILVTVILLKTQDGERLEATLAQLELKPFITALIAEAYSSSITAAQIGTASFPISSLTESLSATGAIAFAAPPWRRLYLCGGETDCKIV